MAGMAETLACANFSCCRRFVYMMAGRMMHGGSMAMTVAI